MISSHDQTIQELVNDIKKGNLLLPEMQRGYVWKATQVRDLFDSLYRGYPSGQLLIWATDDLPTANPNSVHIADIPTRSQTGKTSELLLDGQQRMTSLTAILTGQPLFVQGNQRPIDIAFNVHNERFEVYKPIHKYDTNWISLSQLFKSGSMTIMGDQFAHYGFSTEGNRIMQRLSRIEQIPKYTYRVNRLTDIDYAEVTDIFVRINSGGTRLSNADLALAQLSSRWRGITDLFEKYRKSLKQDFDITIDNAMLIRALASLFSGQSQPIAMFRGNRRQTSIYELQEVWARVEISLRQSIVFLRNNCLIQQFTMLPTQAILIPLMHYFDRFNNKLNEEDSRRLQYWVYLALIWSRYSSSTDSMIDQDVSAINKDNPIQILIQNIYDKVGERPLDERQLQDQRSNSPFMLMCYIIAQDRQAKDWFNGLIINSENLVYHHIFPKSLLSQTYNLKSDSRTVDQVANLVFLNSPINKSLNKKEPFDYLNQIDNSQLYAQNIPLEQELWKIENFEIFLQKRRQMIAESINKFLSSLINKPVLVHHNDINYLEKQIDIIEHRLRALVAERLYASFGDDAWNEAIPDEIKSTINRTINKKVKDYPYTQNLYNSLLDQLSNCLLSHYIIIMNYKKNWQLFSDVFSEHKLFVEHEKYVRNARNAFKHHNSIGDVELHQAQAGILWIQNCLDNADRLVIEENTDDHLN